MESSCILSQKLKQIAGASLLGRTPFRNIRRNTKAEDEDDNYLMRSHRAFYKAFGHQFGKYVIRNHSNWSLPQHRNSEKESVDLKELMSRSVIDITYLNFLRKKELFMSSLRKMMPPPSYITKVQNYSIGKLQEQSGVDKSGLYVLDSNNSPNLYWSKKIQSHYFHQRTIIGKLLDVDYIDTENTDYTYISEESEFNESGDQCSVPEHKLEFNGKEVSMYSTQLQSESNTAPESS